MTPTTDKLDLTAPSRELDALIYQFVFSRAVAICGAALRALEAVE